MTIYLQQHTLVEGEQEVSGRRTQRFACVTAQIDVYGIRQPE